MTPKHEPGASKQKNTYPQMEELALAEKKPDLRNDTSMFVDVLTIAHVRLPCPHPS